MSTAIRNGIYITSFKMQMKNIYLTFDSRRDDDVTCNVRHALGYRVHSQFAFKESARLIDLNVIGPLNIIARSIPLTWLHFISKTKNR